MARSQIRERRLLRTSTLGASGILAADSYTVYQDCCGNTPHFGRADHRFPAVHDLYDVYDVYDLYDLYDLAHVAGRGSYNLHHLGMFLWDGPVLCGSSTASHNGRIGSV